MKRTQTTIIGVLLAAVPAVAQCAHQDAFEALATQTSEARPQLREISLPATTPVFEFLRSIAPVLPVPMPLGTCTLGETSGLKLLTMLSAARPLDSLLVTPTYPGTIGAVSLAIEMSPPVGARVPTSPSKTAFESAPAIEPKSLSNPILSSSSSLPAVLDGRKIRVAPTAKTPAPTGLVTVVLSGAPLSAVISNLSNQTGTNLLLLAPEDLKITLNLVKVPFEEVLRHVTALTGLVYLKLSNTYVIGTKERVVSGYADEWKKAHPDDKGTESTTGSESGTETTKTEPPKIIAITHRLSYVDATTMGASIKAILGAGSTLQTAAGPTTMVPNLGERDASSTTGVTQGVIQGDSASTSKVLILRGEVAAVAEALELAKQLDRPRPQVAIAVTISDVTDNGLAELGLNWSLGTFTISESNNTGLNFGGFNRSPTSFAAAIKGLETNDKAKLLASTSVAVMDSQKAFVLIGSRIKYPEVSGYSQNGNAIVTTKEEKVGVYLQVAPQVAEDGSVTLSLYPQVSTIVGFTEIGGSSYPQIDSRETQTTLRVKSGDTIVIGGLFKNEEIEKIQQVPFLSKLPIIGELFKSRKRTKGKSQVIISLSITVIDAGKE